MSLVSLTHRANVHNGAPVKVAFNESGGVYTQVVAISGGGSGEVRTPAIATVSSDGSVAAGTKYIGMIFSSDFAGTVNGDTFAGATDRFIDFPLLNDGSTYAALAYTISAGSMRIQTVV